MRYYRAQDTFTGDLQNGASVRVVKGDVLPEVHELVQLDGAGGRTRILFQPLDDAEESAPAKPRAARAARKQPAPAGKTGGES